EQTEYEPETVVSAIFAAMGPYGEIDVDEAVVRMETVARQAARLASQGKGELARRAYYALTNACKEFCESYGAQDVFPDNIPYDFAEAYGLLALAQLEDHANAIERE